MCDVNENHVQFCVQCTPRSPTRLVCALGHFSVYNIIIMYSVASYTIIFFPDFTYYKENFTYDIVLLHADLCLSKKITNNNKPFNPILIELSSKR